MADIKTPAASGFAVGAGGIQGSCDERPDTRNAPSASRLTWVVDPGDALDDRRTATMPDSWRKLVAEGVSEGRRNEAVALLADHLLRRYVDPYVVLDLVMVWNGARCRPPLDDDEVRQDRHLNRRPRIGAPAGGR